MESLLRADIPPARAHGRPTIDKESDTLLNSKDRDNTAIVARLKRDNPDIAADVINGTITPNAAAIKR